MAGLKTDAAGNFSVTFRFGGRQFTKSAGTTDCRKAEAVRSRVQDMLFRLKGGYVSIPDGADPGEFIVSGGERAAKVMLTVPSSAPTPLTLGDLFRLYKEHFPVDGKAETTRAMEKIHQGHLLRCLGSEATLESVKLSTAQNYVNQRTRESYRDDPILPPTIKKELSTLRSIWNWCNKQGHIGVGFPLDIQSLTFPRGKDKLPFQTLDEIRKAIARGGLTVRDQKDLWESLYLRSEEVRDVLRHVRENARYPFVYPMFVFAALTGARRSEICRSRVEDWDFGNLVVKLREWKRKKGRISFRQVDLHPELVLVMRDWFESSPNGQYTISKDGKRLTVNMATDHFNGATENSEWSDIPGFHTSRHSFASIYASLGIDETTIDRWMGHQTAEQRERYRHLFPEHRRRAIESLRLRLRD
jgi:integrase